MEDNIKATFEDALYCAKSQVGYEPCENCRLHNLCHTFCTDVERITLQTMEKQKMLKERIAALKDKFKKQPWEEYFIGEVIKLLEEFVVEE